MTSTTAASEVQTLLQFLSQDARIPLSTALTKINDLRKAKLDTPEAISKSNSAALRPIFSADEKVAKQVLAAAKRVSNPRSKKRSASGDDAGVVGASKRARGSRNASGHEQQSRAELEASLALPSSSTLPTSELDSITLQTNRAPLFLAFAVTLLKYTMPEQPLSSRLSLAQAVVSANSRTKAQSIGLVGGKSAEDEGWGEGQPRVKVMGRMVPVMRRSGYDFDAEAGGGAGRGQDDSDVKREEVEGSQATAQDDSDSNPPRTETQQLQNENKELPLWGLDLEALRRSNNGPTTNRPSPHTPTPALPMHTPQSARSYLLKSFTQIPIPIPTPIPDSSPPPPLPPNPNSPKKKPPTPSPSQLASQKAIALSHLLHALDILFSSWSPSPPHTPSNQERDELDSKAWSWYVQVRPDVQAGERGWGQKGGVSLGKILGLRRLSGSDHE